MEIDFQLITDELTAFAEDIMEYEDYTNDCLVALFGKQQYLSASQDDLKVRNRGVQQE